jgi:hypothetical protein
MEIDDPLSITLSGAQWNTVIEALHDAPYRHAAPIIAAIWNQAQTQEQLTKATEAPAKPHDAAAEPVPDAEAGQ